MCHDLGCGRRADRSRIVPSIGRIASSEQCDDKNGARADANASQERTLTPASPRHPALIILIKAFTAAADAIQGIG
ncbi:MAG: hypothetical protein ABI132_03835 [Rhodanobacteraceae bacterium]